MIATQSPRPGLLLAMAMTFALGPAATGFAQATQAKPGMAPKAKDKAKAKAAETAAEPIDLNSATTEELLTLPGVGEATARKIIEGRPHKSVADLAAAGIPAATVEKIKPLAVARALPAGVDVNNGDLKAIETLPGVGPGLAGEIIAARPLGSYDDLAKLKGFGPAKVEALRGRLIFGKVAAPEPKPAPVEEAKKVAAAPKVDAKKAATPGEEPTRKAATTTTKKAATPPTGMVNLNKASKEELDVLPGIGPVRAQQIIDARPFASIEDIMKIKGIKEVEFGKIKDMITVK